MESVLVVCFEWQIMWHDENANVTKYFGKFYLHSLFGWIDCKAQNQMLSLVLLFVCSLNDLLFIQCK